MVPLTDDYRGSRTALRCVASHGQVVGDEQNRIAGLEVRQTGEYERLYPRSKSNPNGLRRSIGKGLVAMQGVPSHPKGVRVADVVGMVLTNAESDWRRIFGYGGYVFHLVTGWVLWCRDSFAMGIDVANGANGSAGLVLTGTETAVGYNSRVHIDMKGDNVVAYVRTEPNTPIPPGGQIVIPYGAEYGSQDYLLPPVQGPWDLWVTFAAHRRAFCDTLYAVMDLPPTSQRWRVPYVIPGSSATSVVTPTLTVSTGSCLSRLRATHFLPEPVIPAWAIAEFCNRIDPSSVDDDQTVVSYDKEVEVLGPVDAVFEAESTGSLEQDAVAPSPVGVEDGCTLA